MIGYEIHQTDGGYSIETPEFRKKLVVKGSTPLEAWTNLRNALKVYHGSELSPFAEPVHLAPIVVPEPEVAEPSRTESQVLEQETP